MGSKWYDIQAQAGERAKVYLYDEIGSRGITAREFAEEFDAITASHVDLYVESLGGSVLQGVAIKNTIQKHSAHVTAHIDSIAGSITSAIVLACDEIRIADDAYVMIHNPSSKVAGTAADMRKEAETLDKMTEGMAREYAARMGISIDEAKAIMDDETWYLGQEAVDAGFADRTYSGSQAVACIDASRFTAKAPPAAIERFTKSPPRGISEPSASLNAKEQSMSDETNATENDIQSVDTTEDVTAVVETNADDTETADAVETVEAAAVADDVVEAAVQQALANERTRTAEITALGGKFGFGVDAETFIASGKTADEFRAHILGKSPEDWKASLAVKNPTTLSSEVEEADESGNEAVAKIKERRKARVG